MEDFRCPYCESVLDENHVILHRSCDYCGRDLTLKIRELYHQLYRPPSEEADLLLKIAMSHLREGSWDAAIGYAKSVLAIVPDFPIAYLYIFMARHRVFALSQLSRRTVNIHDPYYELFRDSAHPLLRAEVAHYIRSHESCECEDVPYPDPEYEHEDCDDLYFTREPGMFFIHFFRVVLALGAIALIFLLLSGVN